MPLVFWIFAGVFLLRLIVLFSLANSPFLLPATGDMRFYDAWARRILAGHWTQQTAFYGLPLYPYLLAGIYKIAGYNPFLPGLLQTALDAGTAVLVYNIALLVFDRRFEIGLLGALGWAFFEPAQAFSAILMPTIGFVFVFWFVVWQVIRRKQRPSLLGLTSLGLLVGFTAMAVATILFLIPLCLAAVLFRRERSAPERTVALGTFIAAVLIGASPACLHNLLIARDTVFLSAHGGVNLWIGNNPSANGYPKFPPGLHAGQEAMLQDSITTAEHAAGRPLKLSQVSAYWSTQAVDWIRTHPVDWIKLLGRKISNFWNAFRYDDLSIVSALRDARITFPGENFGLVAAFAIPGVLFAWRRYPRSRWVAAAVLLHMASLLSVFVTERYRLAAVPGLLLFASFAVCELTEALARSRYAEAAIFAVVLLFSTAFVSLPQRDPTLWALDAYNSGLQALDSADLGVAQRKLDLAYAYSPLNAEVNFAQGNLHLAMHDTAGAETFYHATLQIDPRHQAAWNNLGVLALQSGRWTIAEKCFQQAISLAPDDSKLWYLLARAEIQSGDIEQAGTAIGRALRLGPSRTEYLQLKAEIEQKNSPAASR